MESKYYKIKETEYEMLAYKISKLVELENLRDMFKIFEMTKERDMVVINE